MYQALKGRPILLQGKARQKPQSQNPARYDIRRHCFRSPFQGFYNAPLFCQMSKAGAYVSVANRPRLFTPSANSGLCCQSGFEFWFVGAVLELLQHGYVCRPQLPAKYLFVAGQEVFGQWHFAKQQCAGFVG